MRVVLVLALAATTAGCGTIVRGSSEPVAFNSDPSGAVVQTTLGAGCSATPCQLQVDRKKSFTATFSKDGYKPQSVQVMTEISGGGAAGFAGNIVAGGVIGMGVDAISGAALDHKPNPVHVTLEPIEVQPAKKPVRPRRGQPGV